MARGNQRERDREKKTKKDSKVRTANTLSGTAFQHAKENNADIMREKQRKADERKAAEANKKK